MDPKHRRTVTQLLNRVAEGLGRAQDELSNKNSLVGQFVPILQVFLPLLSFVPDDQLLRYSSFVSVLPHDGDGWSVEEKSAGELIHSLASNNEFLTALKALDMFLFTVLKLPRPQDAARALVAAALDRQQAAPPPDSPPGTLLPASDPTQ